MDALPAGLVTFLFTDVEGSTDAWERHPDLMPAALEQHQSLVLRAVETHGGHVVKETGDGIFAAFADPAAAVDAAVDAQLALLAATWGPVGPLRARMGLHTGEAEPHAGDYHGPPVNRCARIMGVAHGGQVLVSETTHAEVVLAPPSSVGFLDLGPHRLRDLSVALRLYQVTAQGLPWTFPPLRSLDRLPNNLPAQPSTFVGRGRELDELGELLGRTRLLTLTGAGGIGKSRLALQLAADAADRYRDGAWFVDLAGLTAGDLVAQQVALALQVAEQPGRTWTASVEAYLRPRQALVLLDNCEHLLGEVASLVDHVLRRCPDVTILVTSREALGTPGEVSWRAPSLGLPGAGSPGTSEAEELFLQRAAEVAPEVVPTSEDREVIRQICRRLDGLPLAIELAAARVRLLSPREIADRLDDRFRLLTGGSRTAMPRQRTLEAAVAWSHDLLDEAERRLFARLSVFAGPFTLEAAETVCSGDPIGLSDVLDLLTELADRSLVVREVAGGPSRFRLLETLRVYGRDRLLELGELSSLRDRHLDWVNATARRVAPLLDTPAQDEWLDHIAAMLDDVRAALAWSLDGGDVVTGLGCAATLYRYWQVRGIREGRQWLDGLLGAVSTDVPPRLHAKALYAAGSLAELQGDSEQAAARLRACLGLQQAHGNPRGVAWALHGLAAAEWGRVDARTLRERLDEALAIFRAEDDPVGVAFVLQYLAVWEATYGDVRRAVAYADEHDAIVRPSGMPLLVAHAAEWTGGLHWLAEGDRDRALRDLPEALRLYAQTGSRLCGGHCLESVAMFGADVGQVETAGRLLGAVDRIHEEIGVARRPYEAVRSEAIVDRVRSALGGDTRLQAIRAEGRALDFEQAMALAREMLVRAGEGDDGHDQTALHGVVARPRDQRG